MTELPEFNVTHGPVPKKTKKPKPAASFNASGNGPLLASHSAPNAKQPDNPDSEVTRQPAPRVHSPQRHVNEKQFGKHRGRPKGQPNRAYTQSNIRASGSEGGMHAAQGKHAASGGRHSAGKVNQGNPDYKPTHSRGQHGTNYNAKADINSSMSTSPKSDYVGRHSAQGQANRAKAEKTQARQAKAARYHAGVKKLTHAVHNVERAIGHGKHYTDHLRAMEKKFK